MNLAIVGAGTMGRLVRDMALQSAGVDRVSCIEPALGESLYDIESPDVIIDFSHPDALSAIAAFTAEKNGQVGVVFATTGYTDAQEKKIRALAETVPIIRSSNFSYGINSLKKIVAYAAELLGESAGGDIEIVEKHHRQKVDSPSGTALMLAEACDPKSAMPKLCGRRGEAKRKNEIGLHSVRGGTIFGEHSVIFALKDEVVEIKHTAYSKKIFAKGAIEAALWLNEKPAGFYTLEEVFY